MKKEAVIDETQQYRYLLKRIWDSDKPLHCWIMLNPSTADASIDDPTIKRCINFSKRFGAGGLCVVNLYALRSPYPSALKDHPDPIGPKNLEYIQSVTESSMLTFAAWGNYQIPDSVKPLLDQARLLCLGKNKNGSPKHPLYLKNDAEPIAFNKITDIMTIDKPTTIEDFIC